jgi:hypothetical protein
MSTDNAKSDHDHDHGHGHGDDHGHGAGAGEIIPEGSWQDRFLITLACVCLIGLGYFSVSMFTGAEELEAASGHHEAAGKGAEPTGAASDTHNSGATGGNH